MKKSGGPKNAKTPEKVMAKPKAPTSRRALKTYIAERTAALAYLMELEERSLYLMIEAAENMATNTRK